VTVDERTGRVHTRPVGRHTHRVRTASRTHDLAVV
jgi:hypothetical protein